MSNSSYDLGLLNGNAWHQWSDTSGLVYYENAVTRVTTYSLPAGFEDIASDVWALDPTKAWPQWYQSSTIPMRQANAPRNNQRTGRACLSNSNPPPAATYLADPYVAARWIFPSGEGFSVMQEEMTSNLRPDFTVLKLLMRPGGSYYDYDFLIGETKAPGESWPAWVDHLHMACANNDNDMKNVYSMLQIGFEVQFYKHENYQFQVISNRLHLVTDVHNVLALAQHMKQTPMPFVDR